MELSVEARSIVAKDLLSGLFTEVSKDFFFISDVKITESDLKEVILNSWNEIVVKNSLIECIGDTTNTEYLSIVQNDVIQGKTLISIRFHSENDKYQFYIAVNHALADEDSLNEISSAIIDLTYLSKSKVFQRLSDQRLAYRNYIYQQKNAKNTSLLASDITDSAPIVISKTGPLSWDNTCNRSCISSPKILASKHQVYEAIINWLHGEDIIEEGNVICSSHNWRCDGEKTIGMQTGLVPIFLRGDSFHEDTSLEKLEKVNEVYKKLLNSCRGSELFINGATSRSLEPSKKGSWLFPVGIEIKSISKGVVEVLLEGCFRDTLKAKNSLNKLGSYLSDRGNYV
ncbi:hypothetical protein [Vibrio mangrovi]|nr:hypothetical protein [Vibrio mangrovi]MDW6003509.1 hypothetical protein [Vibrio mangrovi]